MLRLLIALVTTLSCATGMAWADDLPLIGGGRDKHGCLPAAGFTWCHKAKKCVRPWEMAKEQGFENTIKQFHQACETPKEER